MVVHMAIKINQYDILMERLSKEMQAAEDVLVFHVHKTDLQMKHLDIKGQRELVFRLEISLSEVAEVKEMLVTAYKVHKTGTLITVGKICVYIGVHTKCAITHQGRYVNLPPIIGLRTVSGRLNAMVNCQIQLKAEMDTKPGFNVREPSEEAADWFRLMDHKNPFLPDIDTTDTEKEDENAENNIK